MADTQSSLCIHFSQDYQICFLKFHKNDCFFGGGGRGGERLVFFHATEFFFFYFENLLAELQSLSKENIFCLHTCNSAKACNKCSFRVNSFMVREKRLKNTSFLILYPALLYLPLPFPLPRLIELQFSLLFSKLLHQLFVRTFL